MPPLRIERGSRATLPRAAQDITVLLAPARQRLVHVEAVPRCTAPRGVGNPSTSNLASTPRVAVQAPTLGSQNVAPGLTAQGEFNLTALREGMVVSLGCPRVSAVVRVPGGSTAPWAAPAEGKRSAGQADLGLVSIALQAQP